ncbi:MAG: hypothetical protein HFJ54_04970 [Clostridia bacterium]|nr:hypothetical protein [Clostridia bacterium]
MNSIEILSNGVALPKKEIENDILNEKFNLSQTWIYDRTGIEKRYYIENETITSLSIEAVKEALKKVDIDIQKIGIIVFATTSTEKLMPRYII